MASSSSHVQAGTPRRGQPAVWTPVGPLTPHLYRPTPERPLRAKRHVLQASSVVRPHCHDWWQLSFSTHGILRMTASDMTYTLPPSRAIWIPPGLTHSVTVVEDAVLYTLYGLPADFPARPPEAHARPEFNWGDCRVLELSDLLRLLALELDTTADDVLQTRHLPVDTRREALLAPLILDELWRADSAPIGVPLPADKRLRSLCQSMLADLARHDTLEGWAAETGASARTIHRLFRQELGTTYVQWRQQAVLAQALAMMARGQPLAHIAADLGYDSASAFSAMFRKRYGESPSQFARRLAA